MKIPTFEKYVEVDLGYPLEKHEYQTEDGYINTCYRIPGSNSLEQDTEEKPVVIFQHGLLDSSMGIVAMGEKSLGIRLVNAGFDLWMNNSRGNKFSKKHAWLDLTRKDHKDYKTYYQYSFQ